MGCVDSRNQQSENQTMATPESLQHRMELLSSVATNQSENDNDSINYQELDRFVSYFNQSDLIKNDHYLKNISDLNRLRFENNLNPSFFNNANFDIPKSIQMFKEHLQWRKEQKVDTILQVDNSQIAKLFYIYLISFVKKDFVFWESDQVQKIYPHGYHKTDKQGRPIYIESFSNVTFKDLYSVTTQERMKMHYIQQNEQLVHRILPGASIAASKFVGQTFTILDAKDMKLKPMEAKNFVSLITSFSTNNYPEIMGKIYVVNSPVLYEVFWKIISSMLNESIRNKIVILGQDYKSQLLEYIDEENLPDFLGGKSNTENGALLRKNIGPWNAFGKNIMFPHENEKYLKKVTKEQKQKLEERTSIQERASQRNSVSQRQSIIKIQQSNSQENEKQQQQEEEDYNNLLQDLEKEIN